MAGIDITMIDPAGIRFMVHAGMSGSGREAGLTLTSGGVKALMDAPIETEWIEDTEGAIFSGDRFLPRDLVLGFAMADELVGAGVTPGTVEDQFRRAFSSRPDPWNPSFQHTRIEVDSELSTHTPRWLSVQLRDAPDMEMETDPYSKRVFKIAYELRAAQPLWESKKDVSVFTKSGSGSGSGFVTVSNPADTACRHTWILTPGVWTLPDPSWLGAPGHRAPAGEFASRTVMVEVKASYGGLRITRERRKLHASTLTGQNALSAMGGKWIRFDIPPHTPPTQLPISVTGAPSSGARAEIHMPRLWTRPVGMEL
ncbi:hypothetical protein [Gordonia malaquae]|uniref:hypothetical protein n=1 Tax=Gordonia malaquae TaxID=410332 RepID=UPI0030FF32B6